ncbi:MAG: glycosyltransferase [Coriobacteriaceae bacterium]|nr:glycosyltransferase [Coriobacteriaceae bacterium]
MKRFVKLNKYDFTNASRTKRELEVITELTEDITVFVRSNRSFEYSTTEGYRIVEQPFITISKNNKSPINIIRNIGSWCSLIRKQEADCISCHDIELLLLAWLANLFSTKKALLIYDSQEFELGRNTGKRRSAVTTWIIKKLEGFLSRRVAFTIAVSDTIADQIQSIHRLKSRPLVVRNIPNYWDLDQPSIESTRQNLLTMLDRDPSDCFLVMYQGALMAGRGLETLLEAISLNKDTTLVVLGGGSQEYIDSLTQMIDRLNIKDSVLLHPYVSMDVLPNFTAAADCGMITIPPVSLSYYYMLPNKLFENIQALTPVIVSDFPDSGGLVTRLGIGLTCDPTNPQAISDCIDRMHEDIEQYQLFKRNLRDAKEQLCWENERVVLLEAYREILVDAT